MIAALIVVVANAAANLLEARLIGAGLRLIAAARSFISGSGNASDR